MASRTRTRKVLGNGNGGESVGVDVGTDVADEPAAPVKTRGKGKGSPEGLKLVIPAIQTAKVTFEVVGTSDLIVNNFSEKSKAEIRRKQGGEAQGKREKKNPFEQFKGSLYPMDPRKPFPRKTMGIGDSIPYYPNMFGIPSPAFKNAMISACRFIDGVPMTLVTGALHVSGYLVPIKYKRLTMREDTVRVGKFPNKVADLRYRGEFSAWSASVAIVYNSRIFNAAQIGNLVENAGFHVGLCEWRAEKKGQYGMFALKRGRMA
jgi:hypothetical protein